MKIERFFTSLWYQRNKRLAWGLLPLAYVYELISIIRFFYLKNFKQWSAPIPLIVIGNISVGGVGKTPLVMAIASFYLKQGVKVGIVSRGYRSHCHVYPHEVKHTDLPTMVGDEALLLATNLACPVVISPKRVDAVKYLLNRHPIDVILSDDGLQHYALGRQVEIAVIDGSRGLGNGLVLPAGPLRERKTRLATVDLCVVNEGEWPGAYAMICEPTSLRCIKTGKKIPLDMLTGQPFMAVAGIGSPERFFNTLKKLNCQFNSRIFSDHHNFSVDDFIDLRMPIVMTEKDAVKCKAFAKEGWYSLGIEAKMTSDFWQRIETMVAIKGTVNHV